MSAKIESLVLQRVQHGDASHKHFVGLAETIMTQINAQHSLYLRRFEGLVLCLLLCFLSETILHGGCGGAEPRTLAAFAPEYVPVSSIKSRLAVDCFFFFSFLLLASTAGDSSHRSLGIPLPKKYLCQRNKGDFNLVNASPGAPVLSYLFKHIIYFQIQFLVYALSYPSAAKMRGSSTLDNHQVRFYN